MNRGEMRSRVRSVVRDTAATFITDDDINDWLEEANLDLAVRLRLLQAEADETELTESGNAITLPADFLSPISLRLGTDDAVFVDPETWWGYSDSGNRLTHTLARIFNNQIELYPTPTSGFTYRLRYYRAPVSMSDSQASELPESLHVKIVHYATARAKMKDDRADEAQFFFGLYEQNLPAPSREKERLFPTPSGFTPAASPFDDEGIHI